MASGRFLSTSIAEDDRLSRLSLAAELLYLKTIPHLDRDGMISGKAGFLWGKVCPLREELIGDMQSAINEWVRVGLVVRMITEAGPVLFFPGFLKNNSLPHYNRERPSRFGPPPGYMRTKRGLVLLESLQDKVQESVPDVVQEFPLQEQEQDQDQEEDQGREIARARVTEQAKPLPPSLLIFQEFCAKPIDEHKSKAIVSTVTNLELWRHVLTEWNLCDFSPTNVRGLLDWYRAGGPIPPPNRNGNHGTSTKRGEPSNGDDAPKLDPELQRQFDERRKRSQSQSP